MASTSEEEALTRSIEQIKDENIRNMLISLTNLSNSLSRAVAAVQIEHSSTTEKVETKVNSLNEKLDTEKESLTDKISSFKTKTATKNHKIKDRPSGESLLFSSIKGKESDKFTLVKSSGTFKNEQQPLTSFMFHCCNRGKNTDFIINRMQSLNVCCMYSFLVIKSLVKWCAITITGADFRWWRRAPPWLN